ncbi:hypothetical protein FRX31_020721 [Thalictrum thalictroides]|uniref:Uncharacterized protein n=1 Tax=Thalictrum thalictroides TaxID=46969 RepID=A0A7J6VZR8_THATH|nr:hypothetical protein FRX31_020721 [Thalictrum thalictroides]
MKLNTELQSARFYNVKGLSSGVHLKIDSIRKHSADCLLLASSANGTSSKNPPSLILRCLHLPLYSKPRFWEEECIKLVPYRTFGIQKLVTKGVSIHVNC